MCDIKLIFREKFRRKKSTLENENVILYQQLFEID